MVRYNIRLFIGIIVIHSLAICTLTSMFIDNVFKIISLTTTGVFIFSFIFVEKFWKIPWLFPWLVPFPDLSGKWKGEMKSNYKDEFKLIPVEVKITQTFLTTQIELKTEESESRSIAASFDIDKGRAFRRIIYTYENEPKTEVEKQSQRHRGTAILNFEEGPYITKLYGKYYTSRDTGGDMILERVENKK